MMGTVQAAWCKMNSECENETHAASFNAELSKADCCKTELIGNSISDKYLLENVQKPVAVENIAVLSAVIPIDNNLFQYSAEYFNDTSPPSSLNNHIYLSNSILLI